FGGQEYIPESTERIRNVRKIADELNTDIDIQVDGGISADNLSVVLDAGANVIVSGSGIFHGNIMENVKSYLNLMRNGCRE
ncbi:MAG: ribulose-phosphate 3-epimerase, partial [Lachnospiraceae bacterium]|nr:ribulose-phosphate 3-epimerase [Lachnospiraceae bacterium]